MVLPDLDLAMDAEVWDELGTAGARGAELPFGRDDAVTHPQYHLKLLLNRMWIARDEVQPWHRAGLGAGPPERSHAISSLFLPPQASKAWVDLAGREAAPRRRAADGDRQPRGGGAGGGAARAPGARRSREKRVAVVTPTAGWPRGWCSTCGGGTSRPTTPPAARWRRPPAGRLLLLLAEVAAERRRQCR